MEAATMVMAMPLWCAASLRLAVLSFPILILGLGPLQFGRRPRFQRTCSGKSETCRASE